MSGGQQGKAEGFLRHLEPLQAALEAFCRRWLRDANDVPDVLQSAVGNAFRDFHLYSEGTNFRAWIFRYVHLEICNRNRKWARQRHQPLPAELAVEETWDVILDEPLLKILLEEPEAVLDSCAAELSEAIRSLPETERSVFLLRTVGEFKYREIAEILGVPIGTVMGTLARGRVRLRQKLAAFGVEHGLLKGTETSEGAP